MSRAFFGKPEFRLLFGYPSVTLLRPGGPDAAASIAVPDPCAALAAFAGEVAEARGRLTAVLPEAETWRGLVALPRRGWRSRRRLARAAAAGGLATSPGAVSVVLGPRGRDGRTPVAGVRCDALAEARAFLLRAGLWPAAIVGAGDFPGFARPPRLWSLPWRRLLPLPKVAWPVPAAAIGALGAVALAFALRPGDAPTAPPAALAPVATASAAPEPAPALRPAARPKDFVPPAAGAAAPTVRTALAAPKPAPQAGPAPVVTVASRNIAFLPALPKPKVAADLRLAELTTARARLADIAPAAPFRRPAPPAQAAPAAVPAPADPAPAAAMLVQPPKRRPPAAAAEPDPEPQAAAEPLAGPIVAATAAPEPSPRPLPRPSGRTAATPSPAIQVASLAPGPDIAALVAAATAAAVPEPRVVAPVARPEPAAPAAVRAAPAPAKPAVQRTASLPARTAKPVIQATPKVVHVQPAPAPKVAVQRKASPQPARVQAAPAPKLVRQQRSTASARPARSGLVLVGIFGSASNPHALLQLPNGTMQRVRAGDRVQGVQVAAVGPEGVRLSGSGKDAVLRLPR